MANAYAAKEDAQKGSLEVGKYGDITILSENWIDCSEQAILDTKILYTIVAGKVKYKNEAG